MSAATFNALADRCERATGADRELDAAISAALRIDAVPDWARMWAGEWRGQSDGRVFMMHTNGNAGPHFTAKAWTASLDAARSLVPPPGKWSITAGHGTDWQACVWLVDGQGLDWRTAVTAALALCSAALRAHASLMEVGK